MLNALQHIWRHPLNRATPLQGLLRFVRWQVGYRVLAADAVVVPFTDRAKLLLSRGMHGATQNIYCGLNDFEDMSFLLHYLRPSDLFVDAGANVGAYTVLASAGAEARTYAFEPGPQAVAALRANVQINRIDDRVQIEPCALGRINGSAWLNTHGDVAMHHISMETMPGSSTVAIRQLDSYALAPAVIKIDVEGYEGEVLAGAVETLQQPGLSVVILENSDDIATVNRSLDDPAALLLDLGFQAMSYDPMTRRVEKQVGRPANTLYLRNLPHVQQRVGEATPFQVFGKSI